MHKACSRNRSGEIMFIKKKIQGGGCHGCGRHVGEGKEGLVKNDMSRDENAIRLELETPIVFVFRGIAKEDTQGGTGCKFVGCCGGHVGVASTPKNFEMLIGGLGGV
jgi:hypothetical protein